MGPSTLRRVAGGFSAALLIGAAVLSTAGLTSAAVPGADAVSQPIPASYSPGNLAGFRGTYLFKDGSTLSKLILIIKTTGTTGIGFVSATKNGAALPKSACVTTTGDVVCTLKTVRTNDFFVVVAAYTPDPNVTQVQATYNWSSSGSTTSDGGTSHGDIWDGITQTSSLNTSGDYAGGFVVAAGASLTNVQVVTSTNRQATGLGALPANVAATVQDGIGAQPPANCVSTADVNCSALFGEWSNVTVGDGQTFGSPFTISIVYYAGAPKSFVHIYLDGNGDPQQEFVGPCAKKSPTYPCFTWSAKTNTATIFTLHNGSYKGQ
jgi:hypothetical protein